MPGVVLRVSTIAACVPATSLHERAGCRCDAGEVAEHVERGAFGGEDRAQRTVHARDRRAGFDPVAVGGVERDDDAFVDQRERARERQRGPTRCRLRGRRHRPRRSVRPARSRRS
jgi:hypothetical protein